MKFQPSENTEHLYSVPNLYNTVIKANTLIRKSHFSLTAQQQKMVLFIISKINTFDEDFREYEFNLKEFCEVCGISNDSGGTYKQLKQQIKRISDKSLWVEVEKGNETLLRWIEKPTINKNSGTIKIRLDKDMKPFLLQLKNNFTEYELIYTLNFKSKYSIRLYEYLKSIHYKKIKPYTKKIDIEEFQKLLDSPYKCFRDFNINVLKPAAREINQYSDLIFSYELDHKGKKVTDIIITIETQDGYTNYLTCIENENIILNKGKKSNE